MIGAICKGLLLGYLLAGPRKDPVLEAQIALDMQGWRAVQAIRRFGLSVERVLEIFRLWQLQMQAYQRAGDTVVTDCAM